MRQSHTVPEIALVNGTEREQRTREPLVRLFEQYPLNKWLYTKKVQLVGKGISTSHPILTLTSQFLDDPEQLLATYIHEQLHWFVVLEEKFENAKRATSVLGEMYSGLPVQIPEGCGSSFANELHLLVNYLEYQGLVKSLGTERAGDVIKRRPCYTKIYRIFLIAIVS